MKLLSLFAAFIIIFIAFFCAITALSFFLGWFFFLAKIAVYSMIMAAVVILLYKLFKKIKR